MTSRHPSTVAPSTERTPDRPGGSPDRSIARPLRPLALAASLAGTLFVVVLMVASSSLGMAVNLSATGVAVPNLHLAAPSASLATPSAAAPARPVPQAPTNLPHETPTVPATSVPSGTPTYNESGRATFFLNTAIPNPSAGNNTCQPYFHYYYYCWNTTTEPTLNVTTTGVTGLAYTAFTNQSQCPSMDGNATTEVGFATSTNFGTTWTTPKYLGNPACTGAPDQNYSSAFEPALTSLPNGTFVLTYIEYNSSDLYADSGVPPEEFSCGYIQNSRIVVTESYNNGLTWTTPTVLEESDYNSSVNSCPYTNLPMIRPAIAGFGNTIYVAWSNASNPLEDYYGKTYSSWVQLTVSTDGGATWSAVQHLLVMDNQLYGTTTDYATNPSLMVDPSGRLYVAYATNYSNSTFTGPQYTSTYYSASILVATSTNNASTFTYVVADSKVLVNYADWYPDTFTDAFTTLAYNPVYDQAYLVYTAGALANFCYNEGTYGDYCYQQAEDKNFFQSSSDNGSTWSTPTFPSGFNGVSGWASEEYNPSLAVNSLGQIDLQFAIRNDAVCENVTVPFITYYCAPQQDQFVTSDDNGTTWSSPIIVYQLFSFSPYSNYRGDTWDGFTSATVTEGTQVLLGWTNLYCGVPSAYNCYSPYYSPTPSLPAASAEVFTSQLYEAVGLTIAFNETGLPAGSAWSVNIEGNIRNGPAGTNLSISGVPPTSLLTWNTPWVNTSYGSAWYATPSVTPPSGFTKNTTVVETFNEQVLVNLLTTPTFEYYFWYDNLLYPGEESNAVLNPVPGGEWVTAGTSITFTESTVAYYTYCICDNLTFQSWTGTGPGSVTSTSTTVTFTPLGPVNETANFQLRGVCFGAYYAALGYGTCYNWTYALSFQESGLPAGTDWGVSLFGPNGTALQNTSTTSLLNFEADVGVENFAIWTLPASGGKFWVPTTDEPSPVEIPFLGSVQVNFTLESPSSLSFPTTFEETGLPNNTAWGVEIGSSEYGIESGETNLTVAGGTGLAINGTPVYLANGTGYYVTAITDTPYVINETTSTISPGGTLIANGSGLVVLQYSPMFHVSASASVGGMASASAVWVPSGQSVGFTETASAGYHFVAWTGSGTGAYSGATGNPSVTVRSVLTEFAEFRPNAPPTWNVTLVPLGLPAGTPFSVSLGGTTYSGTAGFKIGNLTQGVYPISVPTISLNSTETTQFVETNIASPLSSGTGQLNITQNGTVSITFATQYALSIASTPGGMVQWGTTGLSGLGTFWFNASQQVSFLATNDAGYYFAGWNGSGAGSVTTTSPTLALLVLGPVTETAQFVLRGPQPPATYSLAVVETGLPSGTSWSVALGVLGAAGTTATLTVGGLNGSYVLSAPTLYTAPGTRWVSNAVNVSTSVVANGTYTVSYTEQFEVTVVGAAGGSVTPLGTQWVAPGTTIDLTAAANASSLFLSWNGTGSGNYTGTSATSSVTVNGPLTEQVVFGPQPVVQKSSAPSASAGLLTALGLLVALLVVGLVVGLLVGRRRSPPPMAEAEPVATAEPAASDSSMDGGEEMAPPPSAEYDEGPSSG